MRGLLGLVIGTNTRQVVPTAAPVFAALADGIIVTGTKPVAIGLNPVHDVGIAGIGLDPAALTPFVDQDLLDLDLHVLGHTAIVVAFF